MVILNSLKSFLHSNNYLDLVNVKDSVLNDLHPYSENISSVNVFGVKISPGVVIFKDVFESQIYSENISIQNISEKSVNIKIFNPHAWSFRLTSLERGHLLAPGLKISRNIHYTATKAIHHSSLPIYVNDNCYELPLEALKNNALVDVTPTTISFGRVDFGSKLLETIVIRNISSCATRFLVDLSRNELDLEVWPHRGWIRPHSSVTLQLHLVALRAGEISSEIWISTNLNKTRIQVDVEICKFSLCTFHPNSTGDFTLIKFPITFYGCQMYQTVDIYNLAASPSAFVVLADFGKQKLQPFIEAKEENKNTNLKMFDIEPVQGKIGPSESRTFTVRDIPPPKLRNPTDTTQGLAQFGDNTAFCSSSSFQPVTPAEPDKGWKSKHTIDIRDYLCAIKITRVRVEDININRSKKTSNEEESNISKSKILPSKLAVAAYSKLKSENMENMHVEEGLYLDEDISVRLCLYGEAESPNMAVYPEYLKWIAFKLGDRQEKAIRLTNNSSNPLVIRYKKIPFFDVSPDFGNIDPSKSIEVNITYTANNLGPFQNQLIFEVLASSKSVDGNKLEVISHQAVKMYGKVRLEKRHQPPKFNPGITPMITHEVGFLTDEVTFFSKTNKPKVAMACVSSKGRPWIVSDATIAFPNDRPLTLRRRDTDATAKTIFKGLERYRPPVDESMTHTIESLFRKQTNNAKILEFIRGSAALSLIRVAQPVDKYCKQQLMMPTEQSTLAVIKKEAMKIPQDVFVPLTIIQLYHIRIHPTLLSFGNVTTSKICNKYLTIDNQNAFKVSAKLATINSAIKIHMPNYVTISGNSKIEIMLSFVRQTLGRFSSIITCEINGHHSLDIPVLAEVVPKCLTLDQDSIDFKVPNVPFTPSFLPISIQNNLNTPVSFSWSVPDISAFKIEPISGVVPTMSNVWCAAYFQPNGLNYKLDKLKLMVDGVLIQKMKSGVTFAKPNVYFIEPIDNVGYIPLRLSMQRRCAVFNAEFCDAMFVILNKYPFDGVVVYPLSGTIKARSCFGLILNFNVAIEGPINFVVYMNILNMLTIELRVTGVVVAPQVEISPKQINLIRLPCNSVTRTMLVAENKSKARAELSVNVEDYPQFKVSLTKRKHDSELSSCKFTMNPEAVQKFYIHFIPKDLASYDFYLPVNINSDGKSQTLLDANKGQSDNSERSTEKGRFRYELTPCKFNYLDEPNYKTYDFLVGK